MKLALIVSVGVGLAASAASAQVSIVPVPFTFIDISTIPGANTGLHADDGSIGFNALNGNCILPAGTINISSNGTACVPAQNTFTNSALVAASNTGYYPFWDDLYNVATDGSQGNIYAANIGTTTVIEWADVRTFDGARANGGTFEIQIFNNAGSGLQAIFSYVDVEFDAGSGHDQGASATIGAVAGNPASQGFAQWSFNTPGSVTDQSSLGIFCSIPTPGAAGLLGLGGLVALRRRR
jgi:MYXO-CTERM domain-containing protein